MASVVYKPVVRWAFSPTLNGWVTSANGRAELAVANRWYGAPMRIDEGAIINKLFRCGYNELPPGTGVPSRLQPVLQEVN